MGPPLAIRVDGEEAEGGRPEAEADLQEAGPEADLVMAARGMDTACRRVVEAVGVRSEQPEVGRCQGTVASPSMRMPVRARFQEGHSRSMKASSMTAITSSDSRGTSCHRTSSGSGRWSVRHDPTSVQAPTLVGEQPDRRGSIELVAAGALVIPDATPDADAADAQRPRHPLDGTGVDDAPTDAVIGARCPE